MAKLGSPLVSPISCSCITFVIVLVSVYCFDRASAQGIYIGRFPSWGHGLQGDVFILNDRQIRIQGFSYDGQAPSVWFMGMKNGTNGVYSADGIALPNHYGNCRNLQRAYRGADITVTLPYKLRVWDLEAFSVYCYQYCHNFGHVRIPRNVRIPPAPQNLPALAQCYPRYQPCRNPNPNNNNFYYSG